jgi:hypothetical protein
VGLRSIFLPVVAFAVLAGVVLLLLKIAEEPARGPRRWLTKITSTAFVAVLSAVLPALLLWTTSPGRTWALGWGIGAFIVVMASASIASPKRSLEAIALVALVVGVVAALIRLGVESFDPQFVDAAVCVKDSDVPYAGLFVGETDNGVYLGQEAEDEDRVIEIPRDRVGELWIGVSDVECPTPAAPSG